MARLDNDADRIYEHMKRRQESSEGPFIEPAPKRVEVASGEKGKE